MRRPPRRFVGIAALAAAATAIAPGARAQCWWTGQFWFCPPGSSWNAPPYVPNNPYAASRNWGNKAVGQPPPWDASYPGPRAAGTNAGD